MKQKTNEEIANLTKAERNLEIAKLVFPKCRCVLFGDSDCVNVYASYNHTNDKNRYVRTVDYCNRWDHLMSLVIEYDIERTIFYNRLDTKYTRASWSGHKISVTNTDPKLALATCLLLVLREEQGERLLANRK